MNNKEASLQRIGRAIAWRWRDLQPALKATASWRGQRPRVYLHNVHPHPIFKTYLTHPTLQYAPYPVAELCHWVDMVPHPKLLRKPHLFELEHPLVLVQNRKRPMADWFRIYSENEEVNSKIANPNCRRVLTFSEGLVNHSKTFIHPDLWWKLDYVYPAYAPSGDMTRVPTDSFRILVIASRFSDKGVPEALQAFDALRQCYGNDIVLDLVCQSVPEDYRLPNGVFHHNVPMMTEEFKRRLYRSADVLLIPCYSETAACFTEASAYGVPVITTRIHHGDEFVKDGMNGFLVDAPLYIFSPDFGKRWRTAEEFWEELDEMRRAGALAGVTEQVIDRIEQMMENPALCQKMQSYARQLHSEKFSPEVRNRKLLNVYLRSTELSN